MNKGLFRVVMMMIVISLAVVGSVAVFAEEDAVHEGAFELLQQGSEGSVVKEVQSALRSMGYKTGLADGIYGPRTKNAVEAFQSDHGMEVTGVVNEELYNKIKISEKTANGNLVSLVDFSKNSLLETVTKTGIVYTPSENGNYTISGEATKLGFIRLIPYDEASAKEKIANQPTLVVLEKGQTYLISGVQLVCTMDSSSEYTYINACAKNRVVSEALVYVPTEDLYVKAIRAYYKEGTESVGDYEPSIMVLQ